MFEWLFNLFKKELTIDDYLRSKIDLKEVPKFAYKNKVFILSKGVSCYPNEMIVPDCFMIEALRLKHPDMMDALNWINKNIKFVEDKDLYNQPDYYTYPNQTLTIKKSDCEGFAGIFASLFPKRVAIAYGFYNTTGHAFNIVLDSDNKLHIWDAVNNKITDLYNPIYRINYIFTKDHTYIMDDSQQFGELDSKDYIFN